MSVERVPAGLPAVLTVSFDQAGLFIGFVFFDESGSSPVQVGGVVPALNFFGVSYRVKFLGQPGKYYSYNKAAYTDDTYTVISSDEGQGDGSILFEVPPGSNIASQQIVIDVEPDIIEVIVLPDNVEA